METLNKGKLMAGQRIEILTSCLLVMIAILQATSVSDDCHQQLGMEDGRIGDSYITSSSEHDVNHGANNARLNRPAGNGRTGAWSARTNDVNQWIQAELGVKRWVTGVSIQGRADYEQWVTEFKVQYGEDGTVWLDVSNQNGLIFNGNSDRNTVVTRLFASPVQASFIRIRPTEWHGHISMRFEVLGCEAVCRNPLGIEDGLIADSNITSSSEWDANHGASNARLNHPAGNGRTGAWSARTNDVNQWIQVDLGAKRWVAGVLVQGRADADQWVTKFKVQYGEDGQFWKYLDEVRNHNEMVFNGNSDRNTVVIRLFASPVLASFIKIRPTEWYGHISARFEVLGCEAFCQDHPGTLGMEDGRIKDTHITSSSKWDANHDANNARLNRPAGNGRTGAWSAQTNNVNQWIQADLGGKRWVTRVLVQGRSDHDQWVTKFKIQFGEDGVFWQYVKEEDGLSDMVFDGNSDRNTVVMGLFVEPVQAAFIRIRPIEWHGHISMRFEVLGCEVPDADKNLAPSGEKETSITTTIHVKGKDVISAHADLIASLLGLQTS